MRKLLIGISLFALLLMPLAAGASAGVTESDTLQQLAQVRQVTAKYHDVEQALADGYVATHVCVEGMGYHYLNPRLASDLTIDPLTPELLIYAPSGEGLKLVAVEYFVANVGQARPSVMGWGFDGPMAGHEPGMPEHYDLHAWVWQANPYGLFTPFNWKISCGNSDHE